MIVADIQASQEAAGVVRELPGGDPSLTLVPPVEQWRGDYVFLTPDKYAFDFLVHHGAVRRRRSSSTGCPIDGKHLRARDRRTASPTSSSASRRILPFVRAIAASSRSPRIDPTKSSPNNVQPGRQNDGVHRVQSDYPVGVLVYGFDSFVSRTPTPPAPSSETSIRIEPSVQFFHSAF